MSRRAPTRFQASLAVGAVCVALALGVASSVATAQSSLVIAAESVLARYFDALRVGDLAALRGLLGGKAREKRARLLENPDYALELAATFGRAEFYVVRYDSGPHNRIDAIVQTALGDSERVTQRYRFESPERDDVMRITEIQMWPWEEVSE